MDSPSINHNTRNLNCMSRIPAVDPKEATGKSAELMEQARQKMGQVPNLLRVMAHSPAALQGYMSLSGTFGGSNTFSGKVREQVALVIAHDNHCTYCTNAHTAIGKMQGLTEDETVQARQGKADDPRTQAILTLARQINEAKGFVSDEQLQAAYDAGLSQAEVIELTGLVAFNIYTNLFNHVAETENDFPVAPELQEAARS